MTTLTIFVSSPGDVQNERAIVGQVIERLQAKFWSFVRLELVLWEKKALRATAHFNEELVKPSDCDVVLGIIWHRLGTPLPSQFNTEEGKSFNSGTEWEIVEAFNGYERSLQESNGEEGKPDVLIYRRLDPRIPDEDSHEEKKATEQEIKAASFFDSYFINDDGTNARSFSPYKGIRQFQENLTNHLNDLIISKIPKLAQNQEEPPPINGNPYLGLSHFDFHHADRFFGRNEAIRKILEQLRKQDISGHPFILIYGASGYGKSSLMRAGVAPRLTAKGFLDDHPYPVSQWRRVLISPSQSNGNPIEALAHALLSPEESHPDTQANAPSFGLPELGNKYPHSQINEKSCYHTASLSRLLAQEDLVNFVISDLIETLDSLPNKNSANHRPSLLLQIDQFEELFTHPNATEEQVSAFLFLISQLALSRRIWIIATMRSEYFPKLALYPELLPLVSNGGGYILQPPSEKELLEIIRYPALAGRINFEKHPQEINRDLSDDIYNAAVKQPDALPLLEFTLNELYKKQKIESNDRLMSYSNYDEIGQLEHAIGTRAQNTFDQLSKSEQEAQQHLFAQLITVQASGEGLATKTRTNLDTLKSCHTGAPAFIEAFQKQNLLVTDFDIQSGETTVTLAHEALLNNWQLFNHWIIEHKTQLQAKTRLEEQAQRYYQAKENSEEKEKSFLLSEANLAEALRVNQSKLFSLSNDLVSYVQLSQNKAKSKSRLLICSSILFALIATLAVWASIRAQESADAERKAKLAAEESTLAEREAKILAEKSTTAEREAKILAEKSAVEERKAKNQAEKSAIAERKAKIQAEQSATEERKAKIQAEQSAVEERKAKVKAETARNAADKVIKEMIYDVQAELHDRDLAFILNDVTKLANNYFQTFPPEQGLSLDRSLQKIRALHTSSENDITLGNTKEAVKKSKEALAISESILQEFPKSQEVQRSLALSNQLMGDSFMASGNSEKAKLFFQKDLKISEELFRKNSSDINKHNLAISNERLGSNILALGNPDKAILYFHKALEVSKQLYDASPSEQKKLTLSISHQNLGKSYLQLGDLSSSATHFTKLLEFNQQLFKDNPNAQNMRSLALANSYMGTVHAYSQNPVKATPFFKKSLDLTLRIFNNTTSAQNRRNLALAQQNMGNNLMNQAKPSQAVTYFRQRLNLQEKLYQDNPSTQNTRDLAHVNTYIGDALTQATGPEKARPHYEKSLILYQQIYKANPTTQNITSLASANERIANNTLNVKGVDQSLPYFKKFLELSIDLFDSIPTLERKRELAIAYQNMANALAQTKEPQKSYVYITKYLTLNQEIYKASPSDANKHQLATANKIVGNTIWRFEKPSKIEPYFQKSLELTKELFKSSPSDFNKSSLADAHQNLGLAIQKTISPNKAKPHYEKALNLVQDLYKNTPSLQNQRDLAIAHYNLTTITKTPKKQLLIHLKKAKSLLTDLSNKALLDEYSKDALHKINITLTALKNE